MTVSVVTVHPSVTIVREGEREFEVPTSLFPVTPEPQQRWMLTAVHQPTPREKIEHLNDLING